MRPCIQRFNLMRKHENLAGDKQIDAKWMYARKRKKKKIPKINKNQIPSQHFHLMEFRQKYVIRMLNLLSMQNEFHTWIYMSFYKRTFRLAIAWGIGKYENSSLEVCCCRTRTNQGRLVCAFNIRAIGPCLKFAFFIIIFRPLNFVVSVGSYRNQLPGISHASTLTALRAVVFSARIEYKIVSESMRNEG